MMLALAVALSLQDQITVDLSRYDAACGVRIEKKERATLVFVRRGGEWLIAHEHLSAPSGK